MFGRLLRLLFALPVALAVTAGLYFWFSSLLKSDCVSCHNGPTEFLDEPIPVSPWLDRVIGICGGWFTQPEQADTSNSYTRRDKAASKPPDPVACGEDCSISRIAIQNDVSRPLTDGGPDNYRLREIKPAFPKGCGEKWRSGRVVVEFDLSPEGIVTNARVIDSTNKCLDAAALKNLSRVRYDPPVDETGRAVWRRGERQTFIFELEP